jgi:hypothetical protein
MFTKTDRRALILSTLASRPASEAELLRFLNWAGETVVNANLVYMAIEGKVSFHLNAHGHPTALQAMPEPTKTDGRKSAAFRKTASERMRARMAALSKEEKREIASLGGSAKARARAMKGLGN